MEWTRRLPILLATGSGLFTGIIGGLSGVRNSENMVRMLIAVTVFYFAGLYMRSMIHDLRIEVKKSILEKERIAREKANQEQNEAEMRVKAKYVADVKGKNIDYNVGGRKMDEAEEFAPLPVTEFIRRELGE
jgi:hypothetical protein